MVKKMVCGSEKVGEVAKGTKIVAMLGEWIVMANGAWQFKVDPTEMRKDIMLTPRDRLETLVAMVKWKFQISPTKNVFLSYSCPEVMVMDEYGSTFPVSITNDEQVSFFESICSNIEMLCLCVTVRDADLVGSIPDKVDGICPKLEADGVKGKEKADVAVDGEIDEWSSYDSDSDDGDWHSFALTDADPSNKGERTGTETEDPIVVVTEDGECSHKWPCQLDLIDSGDDVDMIDVNIQGKSKPCVLQNCAAEALTSVLSKKTGTLRDAPPVPDENITGGIDGALYDLDYEGDEVFIGRVYRSKEAFKMKMAIHAINQKFNFKTKRSTPTFVELLEVAMEKAVGSAKGSYALLPAYLTKLGRANPGSEIHIATENINGATTFKFLFLSFAASIRGWDYMRRVILLDGTHLHGRYGGCMLTASAQDGNYQIFPLAYAIVDSENDKSWEWFFSCLSKVISDSRDLVFISDRHISIYSGLQKVYPLAGHGACVVHLARNIAARFKGKRLPSLMVLAARKFGIDEFYKVFAELEVVDAKCAEYLKRLGFAHWTRSHFIGMRYNVMTTNIAESLNNVLKEGREFPIISMVESLRTSLMGWFARRRCAAASEKCAVTPKVREKLETNFFLSTSMAVKPANAEDHALAAAAEIDLSSEKLVGDVYYTKAWRAAYTGTIHPVPTADDTVDMENVFELQPPITGRPPGRPKKLRIASTGEFKRRSSKGTRLCTRCLRRGHNKASCKMPIRDQALGL
ncbi:hypothetical protein AALP_AA2G066100 [Arabis alpina]|uniref:MULE transposase domain-containing protein n=1 Tax=Arabis alpina TaxID=50452 RepID=A0A087HFQ3_ARAAL|nr:hypothetical protein AALP_AA2G066100 [Arabis alpina]